MRLLPRLLSLIPLLTSLTGCSLATLNALSSADHHGAPKTYAYGPDPRQRLDIYQPVTGWRTGRPVVVWIYGGSWASGQRAGYAFLAETLGKLGIPLVVPDYRLVPMVRFPGFVEDAAAAVAWLQGPEGTKALGGRPARPLVLAGHSAGAYNAAMVAYAPDWLRKAGGRPEGIAGFVGLAGPYDIHPYTVEVSRAAFGNETDPTVVEPFTHITTASPPALLAHGKDDTTVEPRHTDVLAAALKAADVPVTTVSLSGTGHIGILLDISPPFADDALMAPIRAFLAGLSE